MSKKSHSRIDAKENYALQSVKVKDIPNKIVIISASGAPKTSPIKNINYIDSLKILKGKKTFMDIDRKIQLLKSQLKSLDEESVNTKNDDSLLEKQEIVKHECDTFPSCSNDNAKKSCDGTEMMEVKASFGDLDMKKVSVIDDHRTEPQDNSCYENLMVGNGYKHKISQNELEKLLYKSFVMQNLEKYYSSSESNEMDMTKANLKSKKHYLKTKCSKEKRRKKKKQRRLQSIQRAIRKICKMPDYIKPLNSKLNSPINEKKITSQNSDVDIEGFDWKTFAPDQKTYFSSSDSEVLEHTGKKPSTGRYSLVEKLKILNKNINASNDPECQIQDSSQMEENKKVESPKSVKQTNWECPICFKQSEGQEIATTFCGHVYCKKCINIHLLKSKICPSCCSDLSDKPIITLFNL